jgi:very-short-patch-repair endonuclease
VLVGAPPASDCALRWQAVWESGAGAALDGVAALLAAGLTGHRSDRIDVSLPHANRNHRIAGVVLHRRRRMPPTVVAGIPRVRPAQAAVHAAQWCASDRQAALVLCLVVQQRLVRPADLLAALGSVRRCRRRAIIEAVVRDVCDGVHSLGELDFARICRGRGLPEPSRQVVRSLPDGRVYLDVAWEEIGLVVEIDGGHHAAALNPVDDALRQNEVVLGGAYVLRIPVIGLRLDPSRFMDQVVRAHRALTARPA